MEGWERSRGPHRGLGGVGKPSQRDGRGREPLQSAGGLGGSSEWPWGFRSPPKRAERSRESHIEGRDE